MDLQTAAPVKPAEADGKSEMCMQQAQQQARILNSMPLMPLKNFTPHTSIEFDSSVQEYCHNASNHILHKQNTSSHKQTNTKTTINTYDCVTAPFSRIVRSCKVVVSGDVAVGKTCLVNRFGYNVYSSSYQTTIGVDFDLQRYNILGQPFILQVWDTAGLERFKCITNSYYRGCQAALLVFDMSNMSTLANVLSWKDEVLSSFKTHEQLASSDTTTTVECGPTDAPLLFLVGTKCDLAISATTKAFIFEQANKIANILQAELWFVSAQTGENVNELFNRLAALTFNAAIVKEMRAKFEASTLGVSLKEKILLQQKELLYQSSKLIKITKKKPGDDKRSRCVNVQCNIK